MHHSKATNHVRFSPLTRGWLFTLSHILVAFGLAQGHLEFLRGHDLMFIENYAGILKGMQAKGGDGSWLRAHAFYALATAPLSIGAWYWFGIDAKPRRPVPKIWHALVPLLCLIPLLAFFRWEPGSLHITPGYRSPMLRLIASTEVGTSIVITMSVWLLAGFFFLRFYH